ncbi:GAF domain-containing sensor histidine kinase [Bacillus canaveralius]|uniref:GAF domain-containing sensor histidine kinase n=1 Tax=Bacillus canaveralius TaxID=1403243 RepID=UPI000F7A3EC3|nr:GAF domain-containing sensor histidine kinase [Bacillus canaveralius]RSK50687.1 GAF domain-containing sensor histidine kinase [Bacillus canaveralius]
MSSLALFEKRESYSKLFLSAISLLGWVTVFCQLFYFDRPTDLVPMLLLIVFLFISEYYPMPVWRGFTAITFPLVYVLYLLYGLPYTLVIYAVVVLLVNILQRRPLRIIFFNPAQLVVSLFLAEQLWSFLSVFLPSGIESNTLLGIIEYCTLLILFFIINNTIVDFVLMIRPQPYPLKDWNQKMVTELISITLSLAYGLLLYLLGSQNRGEIDFFSYFFFFSPLVGIALLSSTIVRLKKEKRRMKALFSITTELNQHLPAKEWLLTLKNSFNDFINVEASLLWIKENGVWKREIEDGRVNGNLELSPEMIVGFEEIKKPLIYANRKKQAGIADSFFDRDIKALMYSPLVVENETVGMFIVGKSRTKSFEDDDVQSIATLSNQLAVIMKTRMLFSEKEKRIVLEERNRIARDIHDGLAQTLAGAVMKLETAEKKFDKNPDETKRLITASVMRLRQSLKEVRESIYALRPYPTERVGLVTAITRKIAAVQQEHGQNIQFEIRGKELELSPMVEKVLFDTFQESLQNSIKHARASGIEILLSYQTEHILLKIEDDGNGFSLFQAMLKARNQPHFGILHMNDAADKINASLQIDSKEGEGTEVTLIVPKMGFEGGDSVDKAHASG